MGNEKQVISCVDKKGRLTLPKNIREIMGIKAGDAVFMKIEEEQYRIIISKAQNPFDDLAKDAIREYKQGRTETVEEFVKEHAK